MVSVYTFTRSQQETTEQLCRIFGTGGTAREQWALQAEMLVEPVGWDALWKLSKEFCKKFDVRFPCVACITVTAVDFDGLCATVDVNNVQHETVSLPETVDDVPLIELWPTTKQREVCIDAATTAEFIDLMRFYYNNIWMPWDDQDDKLVLPNTIEERMQLWSDLHNGTIPNCVARSIILLRTSAINAHEKLKELDSSLCEEDAGDEDDSLLPANYITQCAEMTARLDAQQARWTLYEKAIIRNPYIAKCKAKWQRNKSKRNVVALWQGGSAFEFKEVSQFLNERLTTEHCLTITPSAEDALALEPEELVVCNKEYELPEMPLSQISISSFNGATIKACDMRSYVLVLSETCTLHELHVRCTNTSAALLMRAGTLRIQRCQLSDDCGDGSQSEFAQGIVVMPDATVIIEDTTFENFYTGIVVHRGAHVELRNCKIRKCGVGIQMYSGAKVKISNTTLKDCSENSIRCEIGEKDNVNNRSGVEGLQIQPNCVIGCGDLQKEVLIVKQNSELN